MDVCWRETQLIQTQELLPETAENSTAQKMESEAETLTKQINSQTEIFVGKINNFRYGHTIVEQEVKTDCNENSRKRGLPSSDSTESDSKRLKLNDEKTNVITQSLRDVRVCSVDSMMDSGEGESVCSDTCGFRDLKHASPSLIKERQMSMDSTRDSGIGESSKEVEGEKSRRGTNEEDDDDDNGDEDDDEDDDGTCWQPKHRVPISKRLPGKRRFCAGIFPRYTVNKPQAMHFYFQTTHFTSFNQIGTSFKVRKFIRLLQGFEKKSLSQGNPTTWIQTRTANFQNFWIIYKNIDRINRVTIHLVYRKPFQRTLRVCVSLFGENLFFNSECFSSKENSLETDYIITLILSCKVKIFFYTKSMSQSIIET